jgi:hypothetical protein
MLKTIAITRSGDRRARDGMPLELQEYVSRTVHRTLALCTVPM